MLLRIPALLTPEEVATCRQTLEQAPWEDGRATAGQLAAQVKHNLQLPLASEAAKTLGEFLLNKLAHNPLYLSAALPLKVLPPRFNRYEGGGTYDNHIDNALFALPGTASKLRSEAFDAFAAPARHRCIERQHMSFEGGDELLVDPASQHRARGLVAPCGLRHAGLELDQAERREEQPFARHRRCQTRPRIGARPAPQSGHRQPPASAQRAYCFWTF